MEKRFQPQNPNSMRCRFHVQTAGCSLTAQQPENNIVRTTLQALAAVFGGCQSLHTNSMDETLALPTEKSVMIALRTQQIIANESGVTNTVDPLGGSYFVETLTNKLENDAMEIIHKIDEMGGMVKAIKNGYPMRSIAEASRHYQHQVERNQKDIVGLNKYTLDTEPPIETLKIDPEVEMKQVQLLKQLRTKRDATVCEKVIEKLHHSCKNNENIMPALIDCAHAYCTIGEIANVLRKEFGEYKDPGIF